MFILIEIDKDWTVGIDWYKRTKGVRLGFIAIHFANVRHSDFVDTISEHYHKEKIKGDF